MSLWRIGWLVRGVVGVAIASLFTFWASEADLLDGVAVVAIPAALAVVALVVVVFWPPVVYRHWRYRLSGDALEIQRGVVMQRRSAVPYRRVQQVDLTRGPVDRMLGLTAAELTTASASTDGRIPGLAPDTAEAFRRVVLERSGRDDAV